MLTSLGTFINGVVSSAQTSLVPGIIALALIVAGATWALGNHQKGKEAATAALIGGAIMLLAVTLASALKAGIGAPA